MGIRFETSQGELVIYYPDGQRFLTSIEMQQRLMQAEQMVEQERQRAEAERQRADKMSDYLRSRGIDPDNLPEQY